MRDDSAIIVDVGQLPLGAFRTSARFVLIRQSPESFSSTSPFVTNGLGCREPERGTECVERDHEGATLLTLMTGSLKPDRAGTTGDTGGRYSHTPLSVDATQSGSDCALRSKVRKS